MSAAGVALGKKMVENVAKYDLRGAAGMGRKIVGARWKQAATRQGRQALVARAAVGAMGGAAYGYTQGDWKGGAMMGAGARAGLYMLGGRAGLRSMAVKGGFMKRSAAANVRRQVSQQTASRVVSSGSRSAAHNAVGPYSSTRENFTAAMNDGRVYSRGSIGANGLGGVENRGVTMGLAMDEGTIYSRRSGRPMRGLFGRMAERARRFNDVMTAPPV